MTRPTDLVQGTLDLLILRVIAAEKRLKNLVFIGGLGGFTKTTGGACFSRGPGPAPPRLEEERADWDRLSAAISLVMRTA